MPEDRTRVTVNLRDSVLEDLDDRKRTRDERSDTTISRSDVANETIALGLVAAELLDEEAPAMHDREKRSALRQALLDHFRESER